MGEIAEMMLEGTLCEGCGEYMEGGGDGYPRRCSSCRPSRKSSYAQAFDDQKALKKRLKRQRYRANKKAREAANDPR